MDTKGETQTIGKGRGPSAWVKAFSQAGLWRRAFILAVPFATLQTIISQSDFFRPRDLDTWSMLTLAMFFLLTFIVAFAASAITYVEREEAVMSSPPPKTDDQKETFPASHYDRLKA